MIPRPPRSTLFPYTRSSDLRRANSVSQTLGARPAAGGGGRSGRAIPLPDLAESALSGVARSEEHTSELQSQSNLVCRLLLEKKKRTNHHRHVPPGLRARRTA